MASGPYGAVIQQIHRLFQGGSVGGLSEWQLLDRYVTRRDESAFEALVARHGPMVLGVCRRVLDDPHAVEDAFQATFLVLVRKARSLGEHDAIGHWLYGVACRVALRARSEAARRRVLEKQVVTAEGVSLGDEPGRSEIAALLDDELSRLPAKYRAPVVLCYLEGLTHDEAARQLCWPVGTVKGRLARARELLRTRLARRGLLPAVGLLTATLARDASAAVPDSLIQTTVQAATRLSGGGTTGVVVSATVAQLMEGGLSTMFMTKLKVGAAILGTCGGLVLGAWALAQPSGEGRPKPGETRAESKPDRGAVVADKERSLRDKLDESIPLRFQGAPLADVLKFIKSATQGPNDSGVPIYVDPDGLKEAGATVDSPVTIDTKNIPLKASLDAMLRPLTLGATTRDGLLVVSSRQEIAFIELRKLAEKLDQKTGPSKEPDGSAETERSSPAALLKRVEEREKSPEARAKTNLILSKLEEPISMSFTQETPLEDVLKYIKKATMGPNDNGIPIYVDPVGLQEAEKTMTSRVTIDLEGVPLKTTLRLVLKQLGLTYAVKDGLLTITSESSEDSPTPVLELADRATRGELTLGEMNDLVELLRVRAEIIRYEAGIVTSPPAASDAPAAKPANAAPNNPALAAPKVLNPSNPAFRANAAPNNPALADPDEAETAKKTNAIFAALNKVVAVHFKETPLREAIKVIQKATAGPGLPNGIPIYVDPSGLVGQPGGVEPWVTIDLDGVKLKTSLSLMLGQLQHTYTVTEGLLIIAPTGSSALQVGRMGGGGGGGGMGLGGGFR